MTKGCGNKTHNIHCECNKITYTKNGVDFESIAREIVDEFYSRDGKLKAVLMQEITQALKVARASGLAEGMKKQVVARMPSEKELEEIYKQLHDTKHSLYEQGCGPWEAFRVLLCSQIGVSEVVLPDYPIWSPTLTEYGRAYHDAFNDCLTQIKAMNPSLFKERE